MNQIFDKDSAVIKYAGSPRPFGVNQNHKEMAKFSDADTHALEPAIQFLAQFARDALSARTAPRRSSISPLHTPAAIASLDSEDKFSLLSSYDTAFLVDDSPSMANGRWDLVKSILDQATIVATSYDLDGIDIHFLNNTMANTDNVKDQAVAADILQNIVLRGSTPIINELYQHLDDYIRKFRRTDKLNFKGYNLIILTDGEPNRDWEDLNDMLYRKDARINSAAYRLIQEKIASIAKELDEAGVERTQLGIQFCQIGNDEGAKAFFDPLDNKLIEKSYLGRVSCLQVFQPLTVANLARW